MTNGSPFTVPVILKCDNFSLQKFRMTYGYLPATPGSVKPELLDAVVPAIGHVDIVLRVKGKARGTVELAVPGAGAAPLSQVISGMGIKLLDPVVAGIRYEKVIGSIKGQAGRV